MSNSLNADLTDKVVVIRPGALAAEYRSVPERLFRVEDGFGAVPYTRGTAIFGTWLKQGTRARMDGNDVQRLATPDDLATLEGVQS